MTEKKERAAASAGIAQRQEKDSIYTLTELVAASGRLFGCGPDCVVAAFREAGKNGASISEAKQMVQKFLRKEIQ